MTARSTAIDSKGGDSTHGASQRSDRTAPNRAARTCRTSTDELPSCDQQTATPRPPGFQALTRRVPGFDRAWCKLEPRDGQATTRGLSTFEDHICTLGPVDCNAWQSSFLRF